MTLTLKQAYDKGWASQGTNVDWDEAVDRFDRKYAPKQPSAEWGRLLSDPAVRADYELSVAWMDGWSDRVFCHRKGHALRCEKGLTLGYNGNHDGHENCEGE